jgi:hypothetical protein
MRFALCTLTVLALAFSPAAHADTIDDFTITGGGHTITYSLPATSSYPDFDLFNFFPESAPATIDGVSGYNINGDYYDPAVFQYDSLILNVPASIFGTSSIDLAGPPFISFLFVPANNSFPYLPYDVVPTFIPGTYTLDTTTFPTTPYTLTIAIDPSTATPEPSGATLLTTGVLAFTGFAAIRRRITPASNQTKSA